MIFLDVNTQKDYLDSTGALYLVEAEQIKPNLSALTKHALSKHVTIIGSVDFHTADDEEFKKLPPHCIQDTEGIKKDESVQKELGFSLYVTLQKTSSKNLKEILDVGVPIFLEKKKSSIFSNPNAQTLLKITKDKHVLVYGVLLEHDIEDTVLDLLRHRYRVQIVEDAVAGLSPSTSKACIKILESKGAELVTTQDILNEKNNC